MNTAKQRSTFIAGAACALLLLAGCSAGTSPAAGDKSAEDCTPRDAGLTTLTDGTLTVAQYRLSTVFNVGRPREPQRT